MTPREKIETLRRLVEEATPGPWMILGTPIGYRMIAPAQTQREADLRHEPNLRLMEAALRTLPLLLDVAEAAERRIEELYGEIPEPVVGCGCAYCAMLAALSRLGEGE